MSLLQPVASVNFTNMPEEILTQKLYPLLNASDHRRLMCVNRGCYLPRAFLIMKEKGEYVDDPSYLTVGKISAHRQKMMKKNFYVTLHRDKNGFKKGNQLASTIGSFLTPLAIMHLRSTDKQNQRIQFATALVRANNLVSRSENENLQFLQQLYQWHATQPQTMDLWRERVPLMLRQAALNQEVEARG